jgi:hypothetical protein
MIKEDKESAKYLKISILKFIQLKISINKLVINIIFLTL